MSSSEFVPFIDLVTSIKPSELLGDAEALENRTTTPPRRFDDEEAYIDFFEPLILSELRAEWSGALDKFIRGGGERNAFKSAPPPRNDERESNKRKDDAGCAMRAYYLFERDTKRNRVIETQPAHNPQKVSIFDGDAVVLWPYNPAPASWGNQPKPAIPNTAVIGVVERVNPTGTVSIRLNRRSDAFRPKDQSEVVILKLGGYVTYQRERDALHRLRRAALLEDILHPKNPPLDARGTKGVSPQFVEMIVDKNGLNPSQTDAVVTAVKAASGFQIIQGPPGTGKTRTLVALLNVVHMTEYQLYYESFLRSIQVNVASADATYDAALQRSDAFQRSDGFRDRNFLQSMITNLSKTLTTMTRTRTHRRPRLLVCAPSNAAVDEALTRILNEGLIDAGGRKYSPELARLGSRDVIAPSAKIVSGESQADSFLERTVGPHTGRGPQRPDPVLMQHWMSDWKFRVGEVLKELKRTKRSMETAPRLVELHESLERMQRDMRRFEIATSPGMSRDEKVRRIEATYVEEAQLVFATLSGVSTLWNSFGKDDSVAGERVIFDTVVIDEAAQATEPSTIIPLAFGVKRCTLVGDPQQLPATVFSSGFAKAAYGQSMLERLVHAGLRVLMLDTQYRMHPAISLFPSKHFYESKLRNGANVLGDGRKRPYHEDEGKPLLGPYVFVDVQSGSEERTSGDRSMFNPAEVDMAVRLVLRYREHYGHDLMNNPEPGKGIGVVTPYRRQLQALRRGLQRAKISREQIEVDTVDAFQGREKDVIIFSCVRTAMDRGIGFVKDMRRLNVGITRAKCSMILLGNARALSSGSRDWGMLIADAKDRGVVLNMGQMAKPIGGNGMPKQPTSAWGTNSRGGSSDRETMSDSIGSGSEAARRDPRRRREEEHSRLQRDARAMPTGARSDPRRRVDTALHGASDSNDEGSSDGEVTRDVDIEKVRQLEGFGPMLGAYLSNQKRKREQEQDRTVKASKPAPGRGEDLRKEGGWASAVQSSACPPSQAAAPATMAKPQPGPGNAGDGEPKENSTYGLVGPGESREANAPRTGLTDAIAQLQAAMELARPKPK